MPDAPPRENPPAGRGAATRERLLRATVASLVEQGYAATSTEEVRRRAGVSRGALLHHFPSRADLLVGAVAHIADGHAARLEALAADLPAEDEAERIAVAIAALRAAFSGELFLAGLELWLPARTDPELHAALVEHERRIGRRLRTIMADLFGPEIAARPGFPLARELTLVLLRGEGLTAALRRDERRSEALLDAWAGALPRLLGHGG